MKYNHRPWSTPIVIASGLVIVVSGVMLFFHLGEDLIKAAHEWIGIVMAGGILLHIHFHWRSFKQYFKKPLGFTVIALILLASTVLITASGNNEPHPAKQLVEQYSSKSLNQIASSPAMTRLSSPSTPRKTPSGRSLWSSPTKYPATTAAPRCPAIVPALWALASPHTPVWRNLKSILAILPRRDVSLSHAYAAAVNSTPAATAVNRSRTSVTTVTQLHPPTACL